VITVNCGDADSGAIQTIQAELDANNVSDDALTSRVSSAETNLLQETKERKADVYFLFFGLQSEETAQEQKVKISLLQVKLLHYQILPWLFQIE
jgi:hypothetical protein